MMILNDSQPTPGQPRRIIAHFHHSFFVKSETFIYNAISALRAFRPILLAREFHNSELFPFPTEDRYTLSSSRYSPAWWAEVLARRLAGREIRAEKILFRRRTRLIHSHFGPNGVWALRLQRALHLPLLTTFYGYDMSQADTLAYWGEKYQHLFKEGDLFLVEGPHMKKRLNEIGCPVDKIEIQRIAIPVTRMPFRPRLPKRKDEKTIILFSGRFVEKKGLLIALEALREVRQTHPVFEFRIIGDGPLKPEIERFIQENKMNEYVRILGFLNYNDYLEEMKNGDLFLQPSMTAADGDSEGGAPTTILEAQAMGLPVLSTRHADIPYVVAPGQSALLSGERDISGLAANLIRLLEDQQCWSKMGEAGRSHVENFHDVETEVPRLESIYAGLIHANDE